MNRFHLLLFWYRVPPVYWQVLCGASFAIPLTLSHPAFSSKTWFCSHVNVVQGQYQPSQKKHTEPEVLDLNLCLNQCLKGKQPNIQSLWEKAELQTVNQIEIGRAHV